MFSSPGPKSCARTAALVTVFVFALAAQAASTPSPPVTFIALPAGDAPGGIAANTNANENKVFVVDGGSTASPGVMWVIDAATNKVTDTVNTSVKGRKTVAVSPLSSKIYIANRDDNSVTVIDSQLNVLSPVLIPCPTGIDINPFTNRIYVSSACGSNSIYTIDGTADTLMSGLIALSGAANGVTVDTINNRIYARVGAPAFATEVFDGRTNASLPTIAGVAGMSVDPYVPLLWGAPSDGSAGLSFVRSNGNATKIASDVTVAAVVADRGTRRAYAISSGTASSTLVIADQNGEIDRRTGLPTVAPVASSLALIPEKRLFILNADRTVSVVTLAYDVVSLGSVTTTTSSATVPVYLKDAPATPLGSDSIARFSLPGGLAIDRAGALLVTDISNQTIRRIGGGVVSTFAGSPAGLRDGDGANAASAHFLQPCGLAVDSVGNIYVADDSGNQVRKIAALTGIISTVAGTGVQGFSGDGGPAVAATLSLPTRLAIDADGNLYICDSDNGRVRRVDAGTHTITTVAGNGSRTASGDGGPATAAGLAPFAVALDPSGNLFIADDANQVIRKVTKSTGIITTFAGSIGEGGTADGTGTTARFLVPKGIASDSSGNLFVADFANHTIRKITPAGTVTTIAGQAQSFGAVDGAGSAARFNSPFDVQVGSDGSVYVSDYLNSTIRKIDGNGNVTTLAGVAGRTGRENGGSVPRIASLSFIIYFSDPAEISGCSNANSPSCSGSFKGTGNKAPDTVNTARGSDSISFNFLWSSPPTFSSDTDPGDLIGNLTFTLLSPTVGNTIGLTFDKSGTSSVPQAANAGGTVTETSPNLLFTNATIKVVAPVCDVAPTASAIVLLYLGSASGCNSASSTSCSAGEAVSFALVGHGYTFQSCDSVTWDFGDGSLATGTNVTHVFTGSGSFVVRATVSNSSGALQLSTKVSVAATALCILFCSASVPAFANTATEVAFVAITSTSNCSTSPQYHWSFGDGATFTTASSSVSHRYEAAGSYAWSLLTSSGSSSCLQTGTVVVAPPRRRSAGR